MEAHFYTIGLTWLSGRKGNMYSPELNDQLKVVTPPQFPKGEEGIWSPEHLFTAAVNSCFMTTFLAIAENSHLEFSEFSCQSKGKLEQINGKFLMTEIILQPALTILNEADRDRAARVLHKAEAACLISNSITAKVSLELTIKVAAMV